MILFSATEVTVEERRQTRAWLGWFREIAPPIIKPCINKEIKKEGFAFSSEEIEEAVSILIETISFVIRKEKYFDIKKLTKKTISIRPTNDSAGETISQKNFLNSNLDEGFYSDEDTVTFIILDKEKDFPNSAYLMFGVINAKLCLIVISSDQKETTQKVLFSLLFCSSFNRKNYEKRIKERTILKTIKEGANLETLLEQAVTALITKEANQKNKKITSDQNKAIVEGIIFCVVSRFLEGPGYLNYNVTMSKFIIGEFNKIGEINQVKKKWIETIFDRGFYDSGEELQCLKFETPKEPTYLVFGMREEEPYIYFFVWGKLEPCHPLNGDPECLANVPAFENFFYNQELFNDQDNVILPGLVNSKIHVNTNSQASINNVSQDQEIKLRLKLQLIMFLKIKLRLKLQLITLLKSQLSLQLLLKSKMPLKIKAIKFPKKNHLS